ncbi:MAG TPA: hypothetical protein DCO75_09070 [Fibrobacteres bacterium]|jgi:uncharacterized protein (TIGR02145 family)|nr:hypothetical protein [Fibrobacterota bacterium]
MLHIRNMFSFLTVSYVCIFILSIPLTLSALTLSGTVYNQDNSPKSGVIVSLKTTGLKDTTDANGAWVLTNSAISVISSLKTKKHDAVKWDGKAIDLYLSISGKVTVDVFDAKGSIIGSGYSGTLANGYHRLPIIGSHAAMVSWFRLETPTDAIILSVINGQPVGTSKILSKKSNVNLLHSASVAETDSLKYSWNGTVLISDIMKISVDTSGIVRFLTIPTYNGIPWIDTFHYGALIDSRDSKVYRTIKIGSQTWMAQNLNFGTMVNSSYNLNVANSQKYCNDDIPLQCDTLGGLYQWAYAMSLDSSYNRTSAASKILTKHTGICPTGWHVSTTAEWDTLKKFVNTAQGNDSLTSMYLKATDGWDDKVGFGAGTDNYGFRAISSGGRYYAGYMNAYTTRTDSSYFGWCCSFRGMFWTTSQSDTSATFIDMSDDRKAVSKISSSKVYGLCLRCLKD